jgi:REP element-mobilizing transposase RayT
MPYNPAIHNRHSIRLPGYDYTQPGAYYLTILAHKKEHLFGQVVDGEVKLSPAGEIVQKEWLQIPRHFSNVVLDAFVIMPNHMHGILVITKGEVHTGMGKAFNPEFANSGLNALPIRLESTTSQSHTQSESLTTPPRLGSEPASLPAIVQNFKSVSSRKINNLLKSPGSTIWHRNYYLSLSLTAKKHDFERKK